MDKKENRKAREELDELFPEAGFLIEHERSKAVIVEDGEFINVY
jgi:hypothetical protein